MPSTSGVQMPRLLVLDDVLIGLDFANRLPVLRILNEEFSDWQVILTTFDRVWFDLAREYTENSGRWKHLTIRELPSAPGQPGRPVVEPCADLLSRADVHLQSGDLMAAAVYIRAAFETRAKNVCREHGIKVAYKPDPKDLRIDQLWEAIIDRQKKRQEKGDVDFIDPDLMNDVETVRSVVLNRLSHAGMPTLTSSEVKMALATMQWLQRHRFKKSNRPAT
jgi:arginase family enzyme